MSKGKWDLTSVGSLTAAAEWLRKQCDGRMVLIIRGEDVACALDPLIAPRDAADMVEAAMPEIVAKIDGDRREARAKALAREMGAMR